MLIKEYRIPLPLTLEEYSIAQLYMIQKKSREESEGHDSAVEILENRPYTDGPQGRGQYTYKIFHIGRHLPSWFRSVAPKSALEVHEESWNAYPYTKTKFSVPYVEKFSIEIETRFEQDNGHQENIFQLKSSDLRQREVDVIDMVRDQLTGSDYKLEEDPSHYVSNKTGRGPLHDDWVTHPPQGVVMCAYKLIKVEFRYWGLQSKVERFIHDYGLRRVMLRAHRQAWAWQDEWEGLTMRDIRRLERETQLILKKKLGRATEEEEALAEEEDEETMRETVEKKEDDVEDVPNHVDTSHPPTSTDVTTPHRHSLPTPYSPPAPPPLTKSISEVDSAHRSCLHPRGVGLGRRMRRDRSNMSQHRLPVSRSYSGVVEGDSDGESMYSTRPEWALDSIAISDSESDLEFFDALETASGSEEEYEEPRGEETDSLPLSSSMNSISSGEDMASAPAVGEVPETQGVDVLLLVIQGGVTVQRDSSLGRSIDFRTFSSNLANVADLHFHLAAGRWALRQVPCPDLTAHAYQILCQVNPVPVSLDSLVVEPSLRPLSPPSPSSSSTFPTHLPVAVVPLLTTQSPGYPEQLKTVTASANRVYQEFLQSPEGQGFSGQVCLITDCMGSVAAYDILTSRPSSLSPSPTSPVSHSLGVPGQRRTHSSSPHPSSPHPSSPHSSHSSPSTPHLNRYFSVELSPVPRPLSSSFRKHSSSLAPLPLTTLTPSTPHHTTSVGFDFDVAHFFCLGSPLGLVLASRQMTRSHHGAAAPPPPLRPSCLGFYSLSYAHDPMSSRVEPLLDQRFSHLSPATVPVYRLHPKGLAEPSTLHGAVSKHPHLFAARRLAGGAHGLNRRKSISAECVITVEEEGEIPPTPSHSEDVEPFSVWWSRHRLDYLLESPLTSTSHDYLPLTAITHVIHSSYWEAKQIVSFILRQVLHHDSTCIVRGWEEGREERVFIPPQRVEKWSRKRTAMKIKRLSPNHRVNDVLCLGAGPSASLHGKFEYGPLGMVSLAKELVDVYLLVQTGRSSPWQHLDTVATDKHGRASYTITRRLPVGVHPVKLLVRGDHTTAGCNLFIMPPHTEAVVFSVDGALAGNFSLSGKTMKCKPGAVQVASHWRDLGYLLVYLTGRPDVQKDTIMKFLAANGFPLGMVACADSITDPHLKTLCLARLIKEAKMIIQTAYGSHRHLSVYTELGLQRDQIYILCRKTNRKEAEDCQVIGGYVEHVQELVKQGQRPALSSVIPLLGKDTCFALPGNQKPEGRRRKTRSGSLSSRKLTPKLSHRRESKETTV